MIIEEPLGRILDIYCDVNSLDLVNNISENLKGYDEVKLKQQLRDAIENDSISTKSYEIVTGEEYESQEDLKAWFVELWEIIFKTKYSDKL
ncbi:hypothetical protein FLL45_14715 [Aliikangiella marina]|uniref:CdiI immunity protein domain-containing protein n=1 Tax=Aliikangiella marina TaxID=1712262 RepID=A0A545TA66_9GAMM|nr:hypothetical protein [Aliikangiella marina]TQV74106.1 hypothetical protein FLL45_14715 [Aliikangiella marina]